MVTDALLDSFPVAQYDASVAEVLKGIGEYQKLVADWDSTGALPVSPDVVHLAAWLVQMVAHNDSGSARLSIQFSMVRPGTGRKWLTLRVTRR